MWTKTSFPPWSGMMNPKPLSGLNHFTAPSRVPRPTNPNRPNRGHRAALFGAMASGLFFLAIKVVEYADKIDQGFTPETDMFFQLYYMMTGFHALHVVMGLIILGLATWRDSLENMETGAAFWHMIDLIWVLLYPFVYLLR